MSSLVATVAFVTFAGLVLAISSTRPRWSRVAKHALIAFTLFMTGFVGIVQVDLWPFSAWPLIAGYHTGEVDHIRLVAIDEKGMEQRIDSRALRGLHILELSAWLGSDFLELDDDRQRVAAIWLTGRLERSREELERTGKMPREAEPLGPFGAPGFILTPKLWTAENYPRSRIIGIRLYRDRWNVDAREVDPGAVTSQVLYEFRGSR